MSGAEQREAIEAIRSIAEELGDRDATPGEIGIGTRSRIGKVLSPPRHLIDRYNAELEPAQGGNRIPTPAGEIVRKIIGHLVLVKVWRTKHPDWTREDGEAAIIRAAEELPRLCDRLEGVRSPRDDDGEPAEVAADDVRLDEWDLRFLQAALEIGARNGIFKPSNRIAEEQDGRGAFCPKDRRERMIEQGLLQSARGRGVSLTKKGEEYLGNWMRN